MKYEEILRKMKDYDENISKQKVVNSRVEKEKRMLEVSCSNGALILLHEHGLVVVTVTFILPVVPFGNLVIGIKYEGVSHALISFNVIPSSYAACKKHP